MPVIITIILSIIGAIPSIITLIREIIAMLSNASPVVRNAAINQVKDALEDCRQSRECGTDPDHRRLATKLQEVLDSLKK